MRMTDRCRLRLAGTLVSGLFLLVVLAQSPALAALPRTYSVQRIDSPGPVISGQFSLGMNLAGDLNRDGEEDLIIPQVPGFNTDGQVFVFSGENGALLDTVNGPDPSAVGGRAQFGLLGNTKVGLSRSAPPFTDLGSCPGGTAGQTCGNPTVGPADGVPDLLIGATGVDVGGTTDAGRVYVLDGATRAVLKRIDIPAADRTVLALTTGSTGFGRETGTAEGQTGCAGNAGVGPCPSMPAAVEAGDMDGGGRPEVIVGARRITENAATAHPASHCARVPGATCRDAGRTYIYRGEEIVGSSPAEILDGTGPGETVRTLRNPDAQADDERTATNLNAEGFGNDIVPIGDVGACTQAGIAPGARCPRASSVQTPDGRPDVVVSALSTDLPLDAPDPSFGNAGVAYLIDGATGAFLHTYVHPEPQRGAAFGGTFEHTIAAGDLGDTALPDVQLGAPTQNARYTASGRAYVMNGAFGTSATLINFARLDDPTPDPTEENFGGSSAGVGNLVGGAAAPANELMVGESGPRVGPVNVEGRPIDIHVFNPATERVLQSIPDPDRQTSSAFGDSIEPLGDVNEDGFLDFAVGAFRYSGAAGIVQGRVYIFRSDNSPTPRAPRRGGGSAVPTIAGCPSIQVARRTISLTSANDRQNGSIGPDSIFAGAGNDVIDALAGDDCVDLGTGNDSGQGGPGNDLVLGGLGTDVLNGSAGNDRLLGGPGLDRIFGGFGDDRLHGQSGDDRISGSRGRDRINGGGGKDRLVGSSSADRISGDAGNDRIDGGSANDVLKGNSGNDRIVGRTGRDRISCGGGRDTVIADRSDRVARDCERVRGRS